MYGQTEDGKKRRYEGTQCFKITKNVAFEFFQKLAKLTIFDQIVNVARFARNFECDFFCYFQTQWGTFNKVSLSSFAHSKLFFFFLQKKNIAGIILLIWILSILAVLPIAFFTGIYIFNFVDTPLVMKEICMEMWQINGRPAPSLHLTYSLLLMCVQFIIPITVILVTHTKIIGIVRQRTQSASSFRNANRAEVTIRKNKKTTQILLIIAGMFGIHWLPYHIYTIGKNR